MTEERHGGHLRVWAAQRPNEDRIDVYVVRYDRANGHWRSEHLTLDGWIETPPDEARISPVVTVAAHQLIGAQNTLIEKMTEVLRSAVPKMTVDT